MAATGSDSVTTGGPDSGRRQFIRAAGAGLLASASGGLAWSQARPELRWGIVGTGGIANSMAPQIERAAGCSLSAVSSRNIDRARAFAGKHKAAHAFDDWRSMITSDVVDAIYIATPTSVREEIAVAAAAAGKHVLGEKPFASLPSLRRISAACREAGVVFMDGTHFVHHPRTHYIREHMQELLGQPWSVASAFQFGLRDTANIRLIPELEPMGAIGDTGWYNMRAIVEYLPAWVRGEIELVSAETFAHREPVNNAVNRASGTLLFSDGSTSTWNCGFESGYFVGDLRLTGGEGVVKMDDYVSPRPRSSPADFESLRQGTDARMIEVPSALPQSALMFQNFALAVGRPEVIERSIGASEKTQQLLDAVWASALQNES